MPAVIAGLAVAVPLAAAGPAYGYHRTAATAVTGDRAEQLMQCVSEAARQFCASQSAAAAPVRPPTPGVLLPHAPVVGGVTDEPRPPGHAALPQLIDLPPPLR